MNNNSNSNSSGNVNNNNGSAMENENDLSSDLLGTVVRPPSIRIPGSFQSSLSGRLTPRSSPSFRRSPSVRTPVARDSRFSYYVHVPWYRKILSSRRLLPWLIVIGLWAYIGIVLLSQWAHTEHKGLKHSHSDHLRTGINSFLLDHDPRIELHSQLQLDPDQETRSKFDQKTSSEFDEKTNSMLEMDSRANLGDDGKSSLGFIDQVSTGEYRKTNSVLHQKKVSESDTKTSSGLYEKEGLRVVDQTDSEIYEKTDSSVDFVDALEDFDDISLNSNGEDDDSIRSDEMEQETETSGFTNLRSSTETWEFPSVGMVNSSIGSLVGPFHELEKQVIGSSAEHKGRAYSGNLSFPKLVKGKNFMLVFHELSMTGAPLAMMELADEILKNGGKVSVVALSRKGGLLQELMAKGIKVVRNKATSTFRAASRADLVVAGSTVCASWVADWMQKKGPKRLIWWIMENRREYFDRAKHMLGLARGLIFLSGSQFEQWRVWSQAEDIRLPEMIKIVPLSVNGELSLKAEIYEHHDINKNFQQLRDLVRSEMGIKHHDVLVTTLSSINPGKGQLKLLQAVTMAVEGCEGSFKSDLHRNSGRLGGNEQPESDTEDNTEGRLRLLIGSVGSKSNKVDYVQKMLQHISEHPCLSGVILWTPVTVHVASLYAASDVYVMNSQGIGETFGRVTVEAMAFALPVLGTSAGGTPEIVDDKMNGMLHPVGLEGVSVLAQNINLLLRNATLRENMGSKGREKVRQYYLSETMYENIAVVFSSCMKGSHTKN